MSRNKRITPRSSFITLLCCDEEEERYDDERIPVFFVEMISLERHDSYETHHKGILKWLEHYHLSHYAENVVHSTAISMPRSNPHYTKYEQVTARFMFYQTQEEDVRHFLTQLHALRRPDVVLHTNVYEGFYSRRHGIDWMFYRLSQRGFPDNE